MNRSIKIIGARAAGDAREGDEGFPARGLHRRGRAARVTQAQVRGQNSQRHRMEREGRSKMADGTLKTLTKAPKRVEAQIRARVDDPFHVVKNLFHDKKVRCQGWAQNKAAV